MPAIIPHVITAVACTAALLSQGEYGGTFSGSSTQFALPCGSYSQLLPNLFKSLVICLKDKTIHNLLNDLYLLLVSLYHDHSMVVHPFILFAGGGGGEALKFTICTHA